MQEAQVHTDLEQGSEEWHKLRLGKITGSCFHKVLGTKAAREKYLYDRANEIVTGCKSDSEDYVNMHIQRGWEYEPVARAEYIADTFTAVNEVGLVQLGDYIACSPDGLVGDDGMIEIKIPDSNNYFRQVLEISSKGIEAIPSEHYSQMQFNLFVCGREWCDYVLYNPKHSAIGKGLFIYRVEYDNIMQVRIIKVLDECIQAINEYIVQYRKIFGSKSYLVELFDERTDVVNETLNKRVEHEYL